MVGSAGVATEKGKQVGTATRRHQTSDPDHQSGPGAGLTVHTPAVRSREPNLENVFEHLFRVDGKRSRFGVSPHCLAFAFLAGA